MRLTQLRQADLNLLVVFVVLAETRSVSRAAEMLLRSQPAVSRSLQRLREMFHDELLVRTPTGYDVTPHGHRLLKELQDALPRLDRLLTGSAFDANTEEAAFRIGTTDYGSEVLSLALAREVLPQTPHITFEFAPWYEGTFEALDRGHLDLVVCGDDGHVPSHFLRELVFGERFGCVVAREASYPKRFDLMQYLSASHVAISILGGQQTILEHQLTELGQHRQVRMRVPYFETAARVVAGTNLVATVPRRLAERAGRDAALRNVIPPAELQSFQYVMVWHPRLNVDAAHTWLRTTVKGLCTEWFSKKSLSSKPQPQSSPDV